MSAVQPVLPTDTDALFSEFDGGQFASELALALSIVARGCIEHDAGGDVTIKLKCKPAGGAQLQLAHTLTYTYADGKRARQVTVPGSTVMMVNESGRMSLFPEAQLDLSLNDQAERTDD